MQYHVWDVQVDYAKAGLTGTGSPKLHGYIRSASPEMPVGSRPAMVICPGGAYGFTSEREGEPIALEFLRQGFQTFVLHYSVGQVAFPGALLELATSVAFVREHAAEWQIDPQRIAVCGFSAGGHLAASLGTLWNRDFIKDALGMTTEHRPNGMILSYPVISSGEFGHRDSFVNLLRERYEECLELVSLEDQVDADTVPAFLWHTFDDGLVPVENSLLMADALRAAGIPFEMHILPSGAHGMALASPETSSYSESCHDWPQWAARWLRALPADEAAQS